MPGLTAAIASIVHLGGFALAAAFGALRLVALRRQDVAATRFADNGNGIAALLLFGGGLWRLFGQLEKPLAFYSANPVFWVKLGAIAAMVGLEVYPQYVVLPWHFRHARKQPIEPRPGQFARMQADPAVAQAEFPQVRLGRLDASGAFGRDGQPRGEPTR